MVRAIGSATRPASASSSSSGVAPSSSAASSRDSAGARPRARSTISSSRASCSAVAYRAPPWRLEDRPAVRAQQLGRDLHRARRLQADDPAVPPGQDLVGQVIQLRDRLAPGRARCAAAACRPLPSDPRGATSAAPTAPAPAPSARRADTRAPPVRATRVRAARRTPTRAARQTPVAPPRARSTARPTARASPASRSDRPCRGAARDSRPGTATTARFMIEESDIWMMSNSEKRLFSNTS